MLKKTIQIKELMKITKKLETMQQDFQNFLEHNTLFTTNNFVSIFKIINSIFLLTINILVEFHGLTEVNLKKNIF